MKNIEQHFGVEVKFPILADLDMKVAKTAACHQGRCGQASDRGLRHRRLVLLSNRQPGMR